MAEETCAEQTRQPHYSETETIKLVVGKEKRNFFVHHGLLAKIKFFRACLDAGFREGENGTVILEEDHPATVEAFIKWLYLEGIVDLTKEHQGYSAARYAFGDKICCEAYCNDILDARRNYDRPKNLFMDFDSIDKIYKLNLRNTSYAKYALKTTVHQMLKYPDNFAKKACLETIQENKSSDLLKDLVNEVIVYQKQPYQYPHSFEGCQFHNHEQGSPCSAQAKNP